VARLSIALVKLFRRAPLARAGLVACVAYAVVGLSCSGQQSSPASSPGDASSPPPLAINLEAPTFARVAYAKPAPMSLTASDGTGLRLTRVSAKTVVEDPLAYTELSLAFENPEDRVLEGRFRIALPEGAAVSRFAMRIEDHWQEGEVLRKQAARQTYEDFLHRRQDPALLEQGAGNEFAARVFPIAAKQTKEIIISYAQMLDAGQPEIVPLSGLPQIDQLDYVVTRSGQAAPAQTFSKASYVPTADLRLDPAVRGTGDGLRHEDIALVRVRPWAAAEADPLADTLVLLDSSASRALGFDEEIALLSRLVAFIAKERGASTPISVATFDQAAELVYEGPAGSFGRLEEERIAARHALGASDLEGALGWAARYLQKTPRKRVVMITDGVATAGDDEGEKIAGAASSLAKIGVERVDAVSLGGVRDSAMLKHLVTAKLPRAGVVVGAEAGAGEVASRLSKATRSSVDIEVAGASWWSPKTLEGLQPGDEVTVLATLEGDGPPWISIDGKALPALKLKKADPHLLRQAWARARIDSLLEQERREGRSDATAERITALSVTHRVLSPYTSLLVLETEADYQRYGIDRTSLADILTVDGGRLTTVDRAPPNVTERIPRDPQSFAGLTEPTNPWGDANAAKGNMWGDQIGDSFGAGGLGLSGIGEGGGGQGEGIGLGSIGTLGHGAGPGDGLGFGSGSGRLSGSHRTRPPQMRTGAAEVSGRIPPEVIQRIVRQSFGTFRACYERALTAGPNLAGRVVVTFSITRDGSVKGAQVQSSDVANAEMGTCVAQAFSALKFPAPEGGVVTVTYPIHFAPGDGQLPPAEIAAPKPDDKPVAAPYTGSFKEVMDHLAVGQKSEALAAAGRWRAESPGDVLALVALGEALEANGHPHFAARAYGSIVDMYPDRADFRRYAGQRLERVRLPMAMSVARDTYEKARRDRADHPTSHRLLAFAELRLGSPEKAFDVLSQALESQFRAGNFGGIDRIFREDLGLIGAAWLKDKPEDREYVLSRLEKAGAKLEESSSMRVVMSWETDANDVDLHVYDDLGGHASYSNRTLPSGGELYADITTGFGPECFTVHETEDKPRARSYEVFAHYYRRGPMGYGMGKAEIVHHDGKGTLVFEERPYVVMADDAYVALGRIEPRFR
jgi:TonB family protein